jgi:hypothetical protein
MARPLVEVRETTPIEIVERRDNQITRLAAGSLAAAVSVLAIAALVVGRSGDLDPAGTLVGGGIEAGTVSLVDDDQGRLLFDLVDMGPGRPVSYCLEVTYDGSIAPVDLAMRAEGTGGLVPYLDVVVEQGSGGRFGQCDTFVAEDEIFRGRFPDLIAESWLPLDQLFNSGESRSYRVVFEMQNEQDALGQSATPSFVWEVTPS